jgi:hypothetical protein
MTNRRSSPTMNTGNEPPVPADTPEETGQDNQHAFLRRERNGSGRFTRSMETVRRDAAAAEYLADNPGTTYQQLADRFGYYDRGEARRGIFQAKADVARPAITKLIGTESQELDALYAEACAILQRHHVTVSHGKVITWCNPETGEEEPLADDGPKLQAIRVALDVRKAYQELHGLKQPSRLSIDAQQLGDEINALLNRAAADDDTDS